MEERQSQEAARRVHQSSEQGALAARSLECSGERNLYCPIVPLFPRTHHTPAHPVHLQVSNANQPCIPLRGCILSFAVTLANRQHLCTHREGTRLIQAHTHSQRGSHQHGSGRTGTQCFLLSDIGLGVGQWGEHRWRSREMMDLPKTELRLTRRMRSETKIPQTFHRTICEYCVFFIFIFISLVLSLDRMSQLVMIFPLVSPSATVTVSALQRGRDSCYQIPSGECGERPLHQEGPSFDHISDSLCSHPVGGREVTA